MSDSIFGVRSEISRGRTHRVRRESETKLFILFDDIIYGTCVYHAVCKYSWKRCIRLSIGIISLRGLFSSSYFYDEFSTPSRDKS